MPAGRPRHNDVLTPREWQVLDLLRQNLTNDQVAARLGISADTAKFHVSEILAKLGVETRQQAAAWQGRPRAVPGAGLPAAIAGKIGSLTPLELAGAAVIAAAAVALAALAALVLLDSASSPQAPTTASEFESGDEALDAIVNSVLTDGAARLAARFAGVNAREGAFVGGPVGFYDLLDVATADWTARLASSTRTLFAVARPVEPDNPPAVRGAPAIPAALFFAGRRDYDVVLIVEDGSLPAHGWRFSVQDGKVADVIIERPSTLPEELQAASTGPHTSSGSLKLRLSYLVPSPADQSANFLFLPPEDLWPSPTPVPRPDNRPPAGREPTFAPDGRTGDPLIDSVIEVLLITSAPVLAQRFANIPARDSTCRPDPDEPNTCMEIDERVNTEDWTRLLASGKRSLYAVLTGDPADVIIAVDTGAAAAGAWRFGVRNGTIVDVRFYEPQPPPPGITLGPDYFYSGVGGMAPDLGRGYSEFRVLPPAQLHPKPPPGHPLSVRTGEPAVDRLIALIQARDAAALTAAFVSPDRVLVRECYGAQELVPAGPNWALTTSEAAYSVHSIAHIPEGYYPPAQHLIVLTWQLNPLRWQVVGVLEDQGRIVGLIGGVGGDECSDQRMTPGKRSYLIPPLDPTLERFDSSRRSGLPIVDAVLDALQSSDQAPFDGLIDFHPVPCGSRPQIGGPPPCPPGVAEGTPIPAISYGACEGGFLTSADSLTRKNIGEDFELYAVVERPRTTAGSPPAWSVILSRSGSGSLAISVGSDGITSLHRGCGAFHPEWLTDQQSPDFLLPPP